MSSGLSLTSAIDDGATARLGPQVAILLGTRQGERFLAAQLDPIAVQQDVRWRLWASDDHSSDGTLAILERYRRLLAGRFRTMNTRNIVAFNRPKYRMSSDSRQVFEDFCKARNSWLIPRAVGILGPRLLLQTTLGNLGLRAAIVLKKL